MATYQTIRLPNELYTTKSLQNHSQLCPSHRDYWYLTGSYFRQLQIVTHGPKCECE